jgi:hypothetical protein
MSHVGLKGNELVDERTRHAALNGAVFSFPPVDFLGSARYVLLLEWQRRWDAAVTSRFAPYSRGYLFNLVLRVKERTVKKNSTVSRIMSGAAQSHLSRFRIVEGVMCVFLKDYEIVDYLIWHCEIFETERRRLTDTLTALHVQLGTSVRDLCPLKKWRAMKCCLGSNQI